MHSTVYKVTVVMVWLLLAGIVAYAASAAFSHDPAHAAEPADGTSVSPAAVSRAKHWREQATRNLRLLNRARSCFGWGNIKLPARSIMESGAGDYWRARAADYYKRFLHLRHRMAHPSSPYTASDWRPLVRWHWPTGTVTTVMKIMYGESRYNPNARNVSSDAAGLLQFLKSTWTGRWNPYRNQSRYNPEANIAAGAVLYRSAGFGPWAATAW